MARRNVRMWIVNIGLGLALVLAACSDDGDTSQRDKSDSGVVDGSDAGKSDARSPGDTTQGDTATGDVNVPDAEPGQPEIGLKPAFDYENLVLVDEVDMANGADSHDFEQSRAGASEIETILGKKCRVLADDIDEPLTFSYRLGAGGALQAGKGYVLVVEYPEDQPRTMIVRNSGAETTLGFSTGQAVGNALKPPYVNPNSESIAYPLSQDIERFETLFYLHDRFTGIREDRGSEVLEYAPADGFFVTIAQFAKSSAPLSKGAAACRIALYEAPDFDALALPLRLPPEGLPARHLFFREEMSDGVVDAKETEKRGLDDPVEWYAIKARLMRFLGMNTFSKDLLEFGHVQGWDTTAYPSGWFVTSQYPNRWTRIIDTVTGYGLNILPMYEYAGGTGTNGLGRKKRAIPLTRDDAYTHIGWSEKYNVDVSDPEALEDAKMLLKATLVDMKAPRPVPVYGEEGGRLESWKSGWGYVDFGPEWQNIRVVEGWTRYRQYSSVLDATPFDEVVWYDGELGDFDENHIDEAMREETINFMTTSLPTNSAAHWSADFKRAPADAITPKGRYLLMKAGAENSSPQEAMLVGWVEGDAESSEARPKRLELTGGTVSGQQIDLAPLFDESDTYRAQPAKMVGAWIRPRISAIPMGFGPETLARFAATLGDRDTVTRADLRGDPALLDAYYTWWNGQRHAFLAGLRDYLRAELNPQAVVLFTADATECGASHPTRSPGIVTDDPATWNTILEPNRVMSFDEAVSSGLQEEALRLPVGTWGGWEWQHANPSADAQNYRDEQGITMNYSFNHLYTVSEPGAFEDYRAGSNLGAVRHYCLNEDAMTDSSDDKILGYFVANIEPGGPYQMMAEARAVANGDPTHIGYLSANNYNRGFPAYVRNFNANFLALPALKSQVLANAASDQNVVVRAIETPTAGTWLAAVNTGLEPAAEVVITLPVAGEVRYAPTGQVFRTEDNTLTLDLYPGQLVALHIVP